MSGESDRYIPLDEEGYFHFDGKRVDDEDLGSQLIKNLTAADKDRFTTNINGVPAWVEYFDEPLIAKHVRAGDASHAIIDLPYRVEAKFSYASLCVDEWDRFHGITDANIPFVFSRTAQYEFFDLLDAFDDDSVTVAGVRYDVPQWLAPSGTINKQEFWTNIYQTETPGWELGRESLVLGSILPQLKLNKARVLVLGAGSGHDAAYFARQGHMVTAVDFSPEAIERMRANYGSLESLKILQADAFNLPAEMDGRFDLVFEHTCYCAISPERRNDLVKVWKRMLAPGGDLLGIFFVNEKRNGPPFGGSEWELRERLKSSFNFLFWTRWRLSQESRKARELVVYAKKK
ncbi:MAG: methyltransferase domain-containing protein [Bdellovibrionales bacterium]